MWIGECHGKDNRESGIIEEILFENFYQNPLLKYPLWDSVLYEKAMGMSCLFQIKETDHPVKFTPPKWAYKYTSDTDLAYYGSLP